MSMVNITEKPIIYREARAEGQIKLHASTIKRIREGTIEKGDPIYTAKIAAVIGAKQTPNIIPLCHPLAISSVSTNMEFIAEDTILVETIVTSTGKTGVEMEALMGTTSALLTIWDMTKQYEKDGNGQYLSTIINNVKVTQKLKKSLKSV